MKSTLGLNGPLPTTHVCRFCGDTTYDSHHDVRCCVRRILYGFGGIIFGLLFILSSGPDLVQGYRAKGWPSVEGVVLTFEPPSASRYREIEGGLVTYRYVVGSVKFRSSASVSPYADYKAGAGIKIYYDPMNPENSVPWQGVRNRDSILVGLGVVICLVGLTSWLVTFVIALRNTSH